MFCSRGIVALVLASVLAGSVVAQTFTERLMNNLGQPLYGTAHPGNEDHLFLLDKASGQIRILDLTNNEFVNNSFLRVTGLATQSEAGLLGMAFHPDYAQNGKLYVYASKPGGRGDHQTNIIEYTADGDPLTATTADRNSARTIMQFDQPFGNHNGGWIGFNPAATGDDRTNLYIATGDGGSGGDPQNNSQDITNNLLGKMLRIDVDGDDFPNDNVRNYSIPATNPFLGAAGDDEIFAYGLRNPWRSSFDRATGDLWIGDVGQNAQEEIDLIPAGSSGGQNFGWRIMEGNQCFREGEIPCFDSSLTDPVVAYSHGFGSTQGRSVTGGYLYRGPLKEFEGHYFFGDFVSDNIWTLDPYSGRFANQNDAVDPDAGSIASLASFAEDATGNLYMIGFGGNGSIFKLSSTSRDARWAGADPASGNAGDGTTWSDANNWIRDAVADTALVAGDHLILGGNSVASAEDRRVSALTFETDASLTVTGTLDVASGNVFVDPGANAILDIETFRSAHNVVRKFGEGSLELAQRAANIAVVEGTFSMEGVPSLAYVAGGRYLVDEANGGSRTSRLEMTAGTLELTPIPVGSSDPQEDAPLWVSRDLFLAGTLVANLPEGYEIPESGFIEKLPLLFFSGRTNEGEFDEMLVGDAAPGHQGDGQFITIGWEAVDDDAMLSLNVYNALPGDTDGNGFVEFSDFLTLSSNFEQPGDWLAGDFNGDGLVEFDDFLALSGAFAEEATLITTAPQASSVPEPASGLLLLFASAGLTLLRRRKGCNR